MLLLRLNLLLKYCIQLPFNKMKVSKRFKTGISLLSIYILILVLISSIYYFGLLNSWQDKLTDRFFTKSSPTQKIVIFSIDSESIHKVGSWPWPREIFARAINNTKEAKIIGLDVSLSEESRLGQSDDYTLVESLKNSKIPVVMPVQLGARSKVTDEPLSIFKPYINLAFTNVNQDIDSVVRKSSKKQYGFISFSSLLSGVTAEQIPDNFYINYSGPKSTFLTIPIIDLLNGKIPSSVTKDAIVLIGATADDLHDIFNTPFGPVPGVEIHANIVETILTQNYRSPLSLPVVIFIFAITNLLAIMLINKVKKFLVLIPSLFGIAVVINVIGTLLFSYKIIFPNLYVTLGFLMICITGIIFEFIFQSKEKKFIQNTFQYYLMPEVIDELIKNPEKISLGGERRNLTILFSDIAGFTSISEELSPEDLTNLMNEYLTAMTDIIMKHGGLVDKYIGDAVMAFWGAPLDNPNQTEDACRAIVEMLKKLKELNIDWAKRGLPPIGIRIGLNRGDVIVGNMGSSKRFNYTVIGDDVNFASRLEGINNYYGTKCAVSENIVNNIKSKDFVFRELDLIRVKGKSEPKKIFELITEKLNPKALELFKEGREAYIKAEWQKAKEKFKEAISLGDSPSKTYLERVEHLENSTPEDWQGIYDFKSK